MKRLSHDQQTIRSLCDRNAEKTRQIVELRAMLAELLDYANAYSDAMTADGRGSNQLGRDADSVSIAGRARAILASEY